MRVEVKQPRGRPRPNETKRRDEQVLSLLRIHSRTRNSLAEELQTPVTRIYLSLCRLRDAGLVLMERGPSTERVWYAIKNPNV